MRKSNEELLAAVEESNYQHGRRTLPAVSIFLGLVAGAIAAQVHGLGMHVLFWFGGIAVGYPILGALAAKTAELLARISGFSTEPWSRSTRISVAMIWPLVIAFHLITFLPTLVVNSLFRK